MRSFFVITLLFTSLSIHAEPAQAQLIEDCDASEDKKLLEAVRKTASEPTCPNPKKVKNLCMYVSGQSIDPEPVGNYKYTYQRKMLEASCVDIGKDSKEEIAKKVSAMWQQMEGQFVCNSLQFDVQNGNILKMAAINSFDSFIDDAITWKVNLNRVDPSDNRTVLDYLKYHMERTKGGEIEKKLKFYYDQLRKAGAKHKSEL